LEDSERQGRTTLMPKKSKQNNKNKNTSTRSRQPSKRRAPRKNGKGGGGSFPLAAATMLNPCSATPLTGIYGTHEGLGARFHSSVTDSTSTSTAGYILWSPNYSPDTDQSELCNLVGCSVANPSTLLPNDTTNPGYLGSGFSDADGSFAVNDPSSAFAFGTLAADQRVTGACIQMRSIGKLINLQGEMAYISGIPNDEVGRGLSTSVLPSVNRMFDYSTKIARIGDNHVEIKFMLDESSHIFNDNQTGPLLRGSAGAIQTVITEAAKAHEPTWFGFAWRGLDPSLAKANVFDFFKIIEWRPSPVSGLTQIPKQVVGPSLVTSILTRAGQIDPEWWAKHVGTVLSVGRRIAGMRGSSNQLRIKN
jgi:hypothetical protein